MDKRLVPVRAKELMTHYGVGYLQFGYHSYPAVQIDHIGMTHFWKPKGYPYLPAKITVSHDWIPYLTNDEFDELIKHEIAHARTGHGYGHGKEWREMCYRMGIEPKVKFNPIDCPPDYMEKYNG